MNIKLGKQAPALIWSGDCSRKMKIDLTCTDPITMFWDTTILNVPMAPQMFSAPGTIRAQYPWHFQCSVPLALSQSSLYSHLLQLKWILIPPLSVDCQSISGWNWNFPSSVGFLLVSTFPLGMEWIVLREVTVSPNGNWAESSCTVCHSTIGVCNGVVHCLMSACQPHCKCPMFASVLLWKEIIYIWLLLLAAGQPTCASWWCCLSWGWLAMSPCSSVLHWYVWGPVHWP